MALTPQEQAELQSLEAELGSPNNLSPAEASEMQALEAELGGGAPTQPQQPQQPDMLNVMQEALQTPEGAESFLEARGELGAPSAFRSFERGVTGIGGGIAQRSMQLADALGFDMSEQLERAEDIELDARRQEDVRRKAQPVISFLSETAGQVAALPVGGAAQGKLLYRVGSQVGAGAFAGFLQPTAGNEDPRTNALLGALTAGGFGILSETFSPLARKWINARNGQFKKEEIGELIKLADSKGVPLFADDISDSPFIRFLARAAEEVPVTGTSAKRVQQAGAQKKLALEMLNTLKKGQRGFSDEVDLSGVQLKSVIEKFDLRRGQKNKLWEKVIEQAGEGTVTLQRAKAVAMKELVDHVSTSTGQPAKLVREDIRQILQGNIPEQQMMQQLNKITGGDSGLAAELIKLIRSPVGDMRYTIQELKPALSQLISKGARGENAVIKDKSAVALQRVKEALDQDVDIFAKKTPGVARALAKANNFTQRFNIEGKKTVLKQILSEGGQETPEKIMSVLRQGKVSQNRLIFRNMTNEGRQAVKLGIVKEAFENAVDEQGNFLAKNFLKELDKSQTTMGIFFKGGDAKEIKGLQRLLQATQASQRQFGEGMGINVLGRQLATSGSLKGSAAGGLGVGAFFDPTAAATAAGSIFAIGGAARLLFQSKTGRNLLARTGATTPGTKAFDRALRDINLFLSRSLTSQTGDEEQESPLLP